MPIGESSGSRRQERRGEQYRRSPAREHPYESSRTQRHDEQQPCRRGNTQASKQAREHNKLESGGHHDEKRDEDRCGLSLQSESACKVDREGEHKSCLQGGTQSDEHNGTPNFPEVRSAANILRLRLAPWRVSGTATTMSARLRRLRSSSRESNGPESEAREERTESKSRDESPARGSTERGDPLAAFVFTVAIHDCRIAHGDVASRAPIEACATARQLETRKRGQGERIRQHFPPG